MNLYHLKYFRDAVELKSVSASAKRNLVSQPAVSQGIRSLEEFLGFKLLERKPKAFELTESGRAFLPFAREMLALAEKAKGVAKGDQVRKQVVTVVCTQTFFRYRFKTVLERLRARAPHLEIRLRFGDRSRIREQLQSGAADIGFLVDDDKLKGFEKVQIARGDFYRIRSKSAPSDARSIFVTNAQDTEIRKCRKGGRLGANELIEVGSWEAIFDLVSIGFGEGIVPDYVIENRRNGLTLSPVARYSMVLARRKGAREDDGTSLVLEETRAAL